MTKKYIKSKLKTYDNKVNTVSSDDKNSKEKTCYSCIAVIYINCIKIKWKKLSSSVFRTM